MLYFNPVEVVEAVFEESATVSGPVDLGGLRMVALAVPENFEGSTLTVEVSFDGETWSDLHDANGAVTISVSDGIVLLIADPEQYSAFNHLRFTSDQAVASERAVGVVARYR